MRHTLTILLLACASNAAWAVPCKEGRHREPEFIALVVPEDAKRPAGVQDFAFVDADTTVDQLFEKVGPPDASAGSRTYHFIYCFADGTELRVISRDRVLIDSIRQGGRQIYKRKKK
jgi:hypothetical protein